MGSQALRETYDKGLYDQALAMVERGEWTEPWPAAAWPAGGM